MSLESSGLTADAPERRFPPLPFLPDTLEPLTRQGRTILRHSLLSGGRTNTCYKIEFDDGAAVVLRRYARGCPELECRIYRLVSGVIPVPEVLLSGPDYTICKFMPGKLLKDVPQAVRSAGRILGRLRRFRFPEAGRLLPDGGVEPWPFREFNEIMYANPAVQRWLGHDRIARLRRLPSPEPEPPVLVHGDFNPTNLLAENGEITAVLDWEFAMSGPPLLDLANLCRNLPPSLQPEIAAGLADEGVELPREWPRRCRLLDLGSHLEFLTSNLSDDFKRSRVALIDQLLAEYGAAPSAPGAATNSTRRTALRSPSARAISDNTTDPAS